MLPQAANAFFCMKVMSGGRGHDRPMRYPNLAYPPARYRLPPIMPRSPVVRRTITRSREMPKPYSWRPVD